MSSRYTQVVLTVIAVALVWLCLKDPAPVAQAAAKGETAVVRAKRFELVDAQGRVRGVLGISPNGAPGLTLRDQDTQAAVGLVLLKASPSLALSDENGKSRALLTLSADGSPSLSLFGQDHKLRVLLDASTNGLPGLTIFGKETKASAAVGLLPNDTAALWLNDADGKIFWTTPPER